MQCNSLQSDDSLSVGGINFRATSPIRFHSMTPTNSSTGSPAAPQNLADRIRRVARRRWPILAATLATLAIALFFFNRSSSKSDLPSGEATAVPVSDSIIVLDSVAQSLAGIEIVTVTSNSTNELVANGSITFDANRVSVVSSRVEARVVSVRADLGQQVPAGGILAVLESSEIGQTRGDLERSRSSVEIARRNYEREQRLFREQITSQKELLEAESAFRTAEADLRSASSRLRAVGATGGSGATFSLSSPVSGTVVDRNASPGQSVGPSTNLFTVADLRNVWITVDVYENDLARIKTGATAIVAPTALAGEPFTGRVTYAGGVVDTASRTFKVRVEVSNSALRLRPGMFAQVRIQTAAVSTGTGITVSEETVQELNGKQVVFVASGAPGRFVAREVTVASRSGNGNLVIGSGLSAGDRVVTKGAFQVKAELTKASLGEGE